LDTPRYPKDTSRTPSLGKHDPTKSTSAATSIAYRKLKSNRDPELGFEMANEGSVAYARIAK